MHKGVKLSSVSTVAHTPHTPRCYVFSSPVERTGAVGSASDFGPRGPRFKPRQGRRLLWP